MMKNTQKSAMDAVAEHDVENLRSNIQTLQEELAVAKAKGKETASLEDRMNDLALSLGRKTGVHSVPIDLIDRDASQPRTVFPVVLVKERVESLRRFGQLTPVILIPQENARYRLFDGELRYRSAQKLQWSCLDAVFIPKSDTQEPFTIFENQLVTSLHSKRLHDLDLANALLKLLCHRHENIEVLKDRIPTILNTSVRRLERNRELGKLSEILVASVEEQAGWLDSIGLKTLEERQILELLLELQLNPISINSNVLPLLKLSHDLTSAIQVDGLESSKAREINKVTGKKLDVNIEKAQAIRADIIEKVTNKKLSLIETKALVASIFNEYKDEHLLKTHHRYIKSVSSLDISQISDLSTLKELKKTLSAKIREINVLIKTF